MNKAQQQVRGWMRAFRQECPEKPIMPSCEVQNLRLDLIGEELLELQEAFHKSKNLTEVADAIADLLYVVYGTAVACGIDIEPIFNEVHKHNCDKFWSYQDVNNERSLYHPESVIDDLFNFEQVTLERGSMDYVEAYLVTDKNGKVIKPPHYDKPKIAEQLELQLK